MTAARRLCAILNVSQSSKALPIALTSTALAQTISQSLGIPASPTIRKSSRQCRRSAAAIRLAGRTMQLDVMQGAWVSDMLLDAGRRILSSSRA